MTQPVHSILAPAPLESQRFGMKVFRGTADRLDSRALRSFLLQESADLAILRTPGDGQEAAAAFERAGFPFLHADVLVYYDMDLRASDPKPLRNADLEFIPCGPSQAEDLADLVKLIFAEYRNHNMANPFLPHQQVLQGFQEWAVDYGRKADANRCAWLVRRDGRWVAFATCGMDGAVCEGVLYGVHPDHAGGGLYSDLIRFTQAHFKGLGFERMKVSTQIHNLAVQKVWAREGFALSQCLHTWHVNPMLSRSERPVVEARLHVSEEDLASWAAVSGDHNPIHVDDEAARQLGLPGKIAHGLLAQGWISKVLGMDFPGPGTLFQSSRYLFLAPMVPGQSYGLRLSTAQAGPKGFWKCVAQIRNEAGDLVLLAYLDLALKGPALDR